MPRFLYTDTLWRYILDYYERFNLCFAGFISLIISIAAVLLKPGYLMAEVIISVHCCIMFFFSSDFRTYLTTYRRSGLSLHVVTSLVPLQLSHHHSRDDIYANTVLI